MGAIKFFSSSSSCTGPGIPMGEELKTIVTIRSTPDPSNYRIIDSYKYKRFLLLKVNYPDSKNYEGNKILLFEYLTLDDFTALGEIDPHFFESKYSPIARFEPTDKGWLIGIGLIDMLLELKTH